MRKKYKKCVLRKRMRVSKKGRIRKKEGHNES